MSDTAEQIAQMLLDAHGFIVVSGDEPAEIGEILPGLNKPPGAHGDDLNHKVVVVGLATESEHAAQCKLIGLYSEPKEFLYKVVAE